MKKFSLLLPIFFAACSTPSNLSVNKTAKFNSKNTITVIVKDQNDPIDVNGKLENLLLGRGFTVVSEKVALEKAKSVRVTSGNQTTNERYNSVDIQSVYALKYRYTYKRVQRSMTNESKNVVVEMSGNIIDLSDNGKLVATFTYSNTNGLNTYSKFETINFVLEQLLHKLLN